MNKIKEALKGNLAYVKRSVFFDAEFLSDGDTEYSVDCYHMTCHACRSQASVFTKCPNCGTPAPAPVSGSYRCDCGIIMHACFGEAGTVFIPSVILPSVVVELTTEEDDII